MEMDSIDIGKLMPEVAEVGRRLLDMSVVFSEMIPGDRTVSEQMGTSCAHAASLPGTEFRASTMPEIGGMITQRVQAEIMQRGLGIDGLRGVRTPDDAADVRVSGVDGGTAGDESAGRSQFGVQESVARDISDIKLLLVEMVRSANPLASPY